MGDWLRWQQPLDDWYELPDWLLYEKWIAIKRSEGEMINAQSAVTAQLLSNFIYWSQTHNNENWRSVEHIDYRKFFYFQFAEKGKEPMDQETAKLIYRAGKSGCLPPDIAKAIAETMPDNWSIVMSFEK